MRWILANTLPIICIFSAAYICSQGKDGWGWFLVVAAMGAVRPATIDEIKERDDDAEGR